MVCGSNERRVAVEDDDQIVGGESLAGDHQRVSGAALFALQHETDAGGGDRVPDAVGFVPDDGIHIGGGNYFGRGRNHVRQQRLAADLMQHLGMLGFQARPFARCQDGDGYAGNAGYRVLSSAFDPIYREKFVPGRGWLPSLLASMWARASRL